MNTQSAPHGGFGSPRYRAWALCALLVIYVFNSIDRLLLSVLQEKIKVDLQLSDFQLGLLGGPAFVVLYTLSQLPIARLAERANRISIVSLGAAAWSIATATCGLAQNFLQLAASRVAVGIGEAACVPPSHSTISDYFPSSQRATAFAIFGLGIPIGTTVAAIGGGVIAQSMDWRWAFFILGVPGILAALTLKLTVREPPRAGGQASAPGFGHTLRYLLHKPAFCHMMIGSTLMAVFAFSFLQFLVSFLMRSYGLEIARASALFGLVAGVGTALGIFSGGFLADRLSSRYPVAIARLPSVAILCAVPVLLMAYLQSSFLLAGVLFFIGSVLAFTNIAPNTTICQSVAEPRMRATASAIVLTVNALVGYGAGPPLVGGLADYFSASKLEGGGLNAEACLLDPAAEMCVAAGAYGLRMGLMLSLVFLVWASLHYFLAGKSFLRDRVD